MLQGQILASKVMLREPQTTAHNIQESVENSRMFWVEVLFMRGPSMSSAKKEKKWRIGLLRGEEFIMWLAIGFLVGEDEVLEGVNPLIFQQK